MKLEREMGREKGWIGYGMEIGGTRHRGGKRGWNWIQKNRGGKEMKFDTKGGREEKWNSTERGWDWTKRERGEKER